MYLKFYRDGQEFQPPSSKRQSDSDGRCVDIDAHDGGFSYPLARGVTAREAALIEALVSLLTDQENARDYAENVLWSIGDIVPPSLCFDKAAS